MCAPLLGLEGSWEESLSRLANGVDWQARGNCGHGLQCVAVRESICHTFGRTLACLAVRFILFLRYELEKKLRVVQQNSSKQKYDRRNTHKRTFGNAIYPASTPHLNFAQKNVNSNRNTKKNTSTDKLSVVATCVPAMCRSRRLNVSHWRVCLWATVWAPPNV